MIRLEIQTNVMEQRAKGWGFPHPFYERCYLKGNRSMETGIECALQHDFAYVAFSHAVSNINPTASMYL